MQEIDVDQLAERIAAGGRVVDVREPDEYDGGHVPGALSVPLATVADHLEAFRDDEAGPVAVICQSGGRSGRAVDLLTDHDIEATNVIGGTGAWIASGRQTVTGDRPS
ncbi:rhodanese-like domain-containing protein [soil metagenome]